MLLSPQIPILLASFVITMLASPLPHLCKKHVRPRKALKRITKNFMIVDNKFLESDAIIQKVLKMKPRKRRDATSGSEIPESSACPWKWTTTKTRPHEIPSTLVRAVCRGCGHFCRPVRYSFRVLVNDGCDPESGVSVWRWKERRVTIAYVNS